MPDSWDPMDYIAQQASLSMEFSRQEYWSGLPCPPQGDLSNPGIEPESPAFQADSLLTELQGNPYFGEKGLPIATIRQIQI